jgi:hypothetical protein
MTALSEIVPTVWSPADELFFRIVGQVFPSAFLAGATVMLASYDEEQDLVVAQPQPCDVSAPSSLRQDVRA